MSGSSRTYTRSRYGRRTGGTTGTGVAGPLVPRPIRLPITDAGLVYDTRAATVASALDRGGRDSTILSDALKAINGSAGFLGR